MSAEHEASGGERLRYRTIFAIYRDAVGSCTVCADGAAR